MISISEHGPHDFTGGRRQLHHEWQLYLMFMDIFMFVLSLERG